MSLNNGILQQWFNVLASKFSSDGS